MKVLWFLQTLAQIAILCRLFASGLIPGHPIFAVWLGFEVLRAFAMMSMSIDSGPYRQIYRATMFPSMALQILVVVELLRRSLWDYPGIGRFAPRLLMSLAGGALLFGIASSSPDFAYLRSGAWLLITQRHIATALALTTFALLLFLGFVAPNAARRRNVIIHGRLLCAYFAIVAAGFLVHLATNGQWRQTVNVALALGSLTCFVGWALALNRRGEIAPQVVADPGASGASAALLEVARRADEIWRSRL